MGLAKTYYVKGKLCQAAFDSGDPKFMGLYPDILMEAYNNYEKAVQIDPKMKNIYQGQYVCHAWQLTPE